MPIVVRHDVPGSLMGALAYRGGFLQGRGERARHTDQMRLQGFQLGLRRYLAELSERGAMNRLRYGRETQSHLAEARDASAMARLTHQTGEQWRRMQEEPVLANKKRQGEYDWDMAKLEEVCSTGRWSEDQCNQGFDQIQRKYGIMPPARKMDYLTDPATGQRMERPVGAPAGTEFGVVPGTGAPPQAISKPPSIMKVKTADGEIPYQWDEATQEWLPPPGITIPKVSRVEPAIIAKMGKQVEKMVEEMHAAPHDFGFSEEDWDELSDTAKRRGAQRQVIANWMQERDDASAIADMLGGRLAEEGTPAPMEGPPPEEAQVLAEGPAIPTLRPAQSYVEKRNVVRARAGVKRFQDWADARRLEWREEGAVTAPTIDEEERLEKLKQLARDGNQAAQEILKANGLTWQ